MSLKPERFLRYTAPHMASPWIEDIRHAKTPLRFIVEVSKPYKITALFILSFVAVASGINAIEPIIYKNIVDAITKLGNGGSYKSVSFWAGMYLLAMLSGMVFWRVIHHMGAFWIGGVRLTGRYALTSYLIKHSHTYFENRFAGSTANKISHAADGAKNVLQDVVFGAWPFAFGMFVSLFVAFHAGFWTGCIFLVWLGVAIPINYALSKTKTERAVAAQLSETILRGASVDMVSNIRAVQEYARGRFEMGLMKELIQKRHIAGLRNWMYSQRIAIINSVLQLFFVSLMLAVITYLAYLGKVTPGTIILVFALATYVGERVFYLSNQMANLSEHWGEIREGLQDILNEHEIPDADGAQKLKLSEGNINFISAEFAYHQGESVIRDFNLEIPAGQKVGLVGRSGAGKTTLIKLLLRHYDLTGGGIEIDGQNISKVTQDSLRESISVVPQEPLLFHRTIGENIGYGKEGATDGEIRTAAKLAQAHDFILALPQTYDTLVGERGVKLSGGQRQRVAIARALLKPSKILVLDEATSSLDSESEGDIQKGLESLMVGKTVIAIAHRLSTLRAMDRILVLENGVVIEDGNHDKLIKKKGGVYAGMWKHQSGGYLKEE